jgi:hypothetical protein
MSLFHSSGLASFCGTARSFPGLRARPCTRAAPFPVTSARPPPSRVATMFVLGALGATAASCAASVAATCACHAAGALASRSARLAYCVFFLASTLLAYVLREGAAPVVGHLPCELCRRCWRQPWLCLFLVRPRPHLRPSRKPRTARRTECATRAHVCMGRAAAKSRGRAPIFRARFSDRSTPTCAARAPLRSHSPSPYPTPHLPTPHPTSLSQGSPAPPPHTSRPTPFTATRPSCACPWRPRPFSGAWLRP